MRGYFNTLNTTSIESETEAKKLNENRDLRPSRVPSIALASTVDEEEEKGDLG